MPCQAVKRLMKGHEDGMIELQAPLPEDHQGQKICQIGAVILSNNNLHKL